MSTADLITGFQGYAAGGGYPEPTPDALRRRTAAKDPKGRRAHEASGGVLFGLLASSLTDIAGPLGQVGDYLDRVADASEMVSARRSRSSDPRKLAAERNQRLNRGTPLDGTIFEESGSWWNTPSPG